MRMLLCLITAASMLVAAERIEVHGHRGARALRPENTIPAFEYAIAQGVDVLELDLGITKDGVVLVSHDSWLKAPICTGPKEQAISWESTLAELRQWDCGATRNPQFAKQQTVPGTRIPTLDEVFTMASKSSVRFNIETKIDPREPKLTAAPAEFARRVLD